MRIGGDMFSRCLRALALCAVAAMFSASAMAQTYPAQPIKVLIGFGPGSAADVLARLVGKQMEASLGQPSWSRTAPATAA